MVILDYEDAEVHSDIRRISPDELTLVKVIDEGGGDADGVYEGLWNEERVVLKAKHNEYSGWMRVEANSLFTLQGVPASPVLHGFVEGDANLRTTEDDVEVPLITAGIVTKYASGTPIMAVPQYSNREASRLYHGETGINLAHVISHQLAGYMRGSLERGLVDGDLPERDIFVDVAGSSVTVTKIDQGHMKNRRDIDLEQFDIEIYEAKYNHALKFLLVLPMIHLSSGQRQDIANYDNVQESLRGAEAFFRGNGLSDLPNLINSYLRGEFATNTFPNGKGMPDDVTFLDFLQRWEAAMQEHGEYFVK